MKHGSFRAIRLVFKAFASEVYNNPEFHLNLRCALIDFLKKIRNLSVL